MALTLDPRAVPVASTEQLAALQAQCRQVLEHVGGRVESGFFRGRWLRRDGRGLHLGLQLCGSRLHHWGHRFGLSLDQLCAGLGVSNLTRHQARIEQLKVIGNWRRLVRCRLLFRQ